MLGITGPFEVDFQGQIRRITADNVYAEINGQRQLHHEPDDGPDHKDMLGLIGKNLIDRLKQANRNTLGLAAQQFLAACEHRDVQVYAADPNVQAALDRWDCTGRLLPDPQTPTLAITYANLVLSKTSLDMRPRLTMTIDPASEGQRRVTLALVLRNGTVPEEDPYYFGFQRWWVEANLPTGSTLLSDPGPMANPESPNGGSYLAAVFPRQTGQIDIVFTMPDSPTLLIRRQPGVRIGDLVIAQRGCEPAVDTELTDDLLVDLSSLCQSR
jgi:hypothetical protein